MRAGVWGLITLEAWMSPHSCHATKNAAPFAVLIIKGAGTPIALVQHLLLNLEDLQCCRGWLKTTGVLCRHKVVTVLPWEVMVEVQFQTWVLTIDRSDLEYPIAL